VLLPTPGHTPGHLSVLIDSGEWRVLCVGDVMYTLRHLDTDAVRPIMLGKRARTAQLASIDRIRQLYCSQPGLTILPGHDHTEYGRALLNALQGSPSAEDWAGVHAVERALVGPDGRAIGPVVPRYVPGLIGEPVGEVEFIARPTKGG
jgi:glyoxylase-like metal-dependent hydrolase (beta-lactamase superfamily II)